MSIVYFDSSAFVKLFLAEAEREVAVELWHGCDAAVSSSVVNAEVCAALGAANRAHRLNDEQLRVTLALWSEVRKNTRIIELDSIVSKLAGSFARGQRLSGADAIHLASAISTGIPDLVFATWDRRLRQGAFNSGFRTTAPDDVVGRAR